MAEIIQRVRPGRAADQRVRLRRRTTRALSLFQRQLPRRCRRTAPPPIDYPYRFIAPSNTGIPSGFDLNNNGVVGGPGRRLRLRLLPRPVRHGRLLEVPDRHDRRPHVPELPLEGHAGRAAAGRPGHAGAGRLVLARRSSTSSGCRPRATGTCRSDRRQDRPLPRQPPDAAGVRRPRGPQRHAQPRRDPVLGRLHHARAERGYIYDDAGGTAASRPARCSSSPATRTPTRSTATASRARSSSCSSTRSSTRRSRPTSAGAVEAAALQGGANLTHRSDPRVRHRRLRRHARPGNLRADYVLPREEPARSSTPRVFWPLTTDPLFRAHRRLPVPELRPPARLDRRRSTKPRRTRRWGGPGPAGARPSHDRVRPQAPRRRHSPRRTAADGERARRTSRCGRARGVPRGELGNDLGITEPQVHELLVAEVLDDLDRRVEVRGVGLPFPSSTCSGRNPTSCPEPPTPTTKRRTGTRFIAGDPMKRATKTLRASCRGPPACRSAAGRRGSSPRSGRPSSSPRSGRASRRSSWSRGGRWSFRISARVWTRSAASRFESGSSIRNAAGSRTIARPSATRCRWPPESCFGLRLSSSLSSRISAASLHALVDLASSAPCGCAGRTRGCRRRSCADRARRTGRPSRCRARPARRC